MVEESGVYVVVVMQNKVVQVIEKEDLMTVYEFKVNKYD